MACFILSCFINKNPSSKYPLFTHIILVFLRKFPILEIICPKPQPNLWVGRNQTQMAYNSTNHPPSLKIETTLYKEHHRQESGHFLLMTTEGSQSQPCRHGKQGPYRHEKIYYDFQFLKFDYSIPFISLTLCAAVPMFGFE